MPLQEVPVALAERSAGQQPLRRVMSRFGAFARIVRAIRANSARESRARRESFDRALAIQRVPLAQ